MVSGPLLTRALAADDPAVFKNAPISVQVVGRTLEEEAVIAMSEIVDNAIKKFGSSS